jgi:hypothetical protein
MGRNCDKCIPKVSITWIRRKSTEKSGSRKYAKGPDFRLRAAAPGAKTIQRARWSRLRAAWGLDRYKQTRKIEKMAEHKKDYVRVDRALTGGG